MEDARESFKRWWASESSQKTYNMTRKEACEHAWMECQWYCVQRMFEYFRDQKEQLGEK